MAKSLRNRSGKVRTDDELSHIKGSGANALAAHFGGTFVEESRSDGTMASSEFTPDVAEEEERISAHDRLRRFVPIDEAPARPLCGQSFAFFARSARF